MAKLIHTMIRVRDLDASLKFYREVLDLTPSHTLDFPDFGLVYLRNAENDVELELTLNKGRQEPYTHGDGYGHVAVVVDDVATKHAELLRAGYEPLAVKEFKANDALLARFFFIQDPDGYKIEVLERLDLVAVGEEAVELEEEAEVAGEEGGDVLHHLDRVEEAAREVEHHLHEELLLARLERKRLAHVDEEALGVGLARLLTRRRAARRRRGNATSWWRSCKGTWRRPKTPRTRPKRRPRRARKARPRRRRTPTRCGRKWSKRRRPWPRRCAASSRATG